jgi:hypothetical protein
MDLVISLVSWHKFLPGYLSWFYACAYLEQFLVYIFPVSSHGLSLVSGFYSLSVL